MALPADGLNYFAQITEMRRIIDMKDGHPDADGNPTKDVTFEDGTTAVVLAVDIFTESPQNNDPE